LDRRALVRVGRLEQLALQHAARLHLQDGCVRRCGSVWAL
jgi:hypothetical protein